MTMEDLANQLAEVAKRRDSALPSDFDNLLSQIAELQDPRAIAALVPILDDQFPFDELMFSLVHTIEMFDDAVYVREILGATSSLWANSPRWAAILYMRILNSAGTRQELERQIERAPDAERDAVRQIAAAICRDRPEFRERSSGLL